MGVSEERIDELLEIMLNNADDDGWCHIPDGLTDEEEMELSTRLTIISMQDRIDTLMEGVLGVIKYIGSIRNFIEKDEYDTMEKLRLKGGLLTIKEDSQSLLMDLHSSDLIGDFFKIDLISIDTDESKDIMTKAKTQMIELSETEFKEQLDKLKGYFKVIIDQSDEISEILENES